MHRAPQRLSPSSRPCCDRRLSACKLAVRHRPTNPKRRSLRGSCSVNTLLELRHSKRHRRQWNQVNRASPPPCDYLFPPPDLRTDHQKFIQSVRVCEARNLEPAIRELSQHIGDAGDNNDFWWADREPRLTKPLIEKLEDAGEIHQGSLPLAPESHELRMLPRSFRKIWPVVLHNRPEQRRARDPARTPRASATALDRRRMPWFSEKPGAVGSQSRSRLPGHIS